MAQISTAQTVTATINCQGLAAKKAPTNTDISIIKQLWCGFDRASSLICGNKMPTRCNRWFLLQILLHAQHVSGAPLCPSSGAREYYTDGRCLWYLVLWFSSFGMVWSWGLCVRFAACCFKAPNTTGSNHLYNTLELLMMGIMVPETCWASNKISNKNSSVASCWHFISTYTDNRFAFWTGKILLIRTFRCHNTQYTTTFRKISVLIFLWIESILKSI